MKLSLKGLFDKEHRAHSLAGIAFVTAVLIALGAFLFAKPPYADLEAALAVGNFDVVILRGEALLTEHPSDRTLVKLLSAAYLEKAETAPDRGTWVKKSRVLLTDSHVKNSNDAEMLRLLGYGQYLLRSYDNAETYYQKAANLAPKNAAIWVNLGEVAEAKGAIMSAKDLYDKATGFNKSFEPALIGEMSVMAKTGQYEKATLETKKLIEVSRNNLSKARFYEILGFIAWKQNDVPLAIANFKQALAFNEVRVPSLALYADALLKNVTAKKGADLVKETQLPFSLAVKAQKLDPSYPYPYAVLSTIASLRGDTANAKKYAGNVITTLSRSPLMQSEKDALTAKFGK